MTTAINEYRAGPKVGARSEFMVVGDVIPGHEEALRQTLERHMTGPRTQQAINQIGTLHEARFVLLDGDTRLVFASSFDGPWDVYIDDFATTDIGRNFDDTWQHVQGYPGVKSPNVKEWFKERTVVAGNFVRACPEPTVKQVWKALALQKAFQQVLDTPGAEEALQHPALKPLLDLAAD
ncbi:MAG TPA: hypothetical protein VJT49_24795 [Amycolatopsis sp.]|uniref:hypothetical protein n=1 Tax=Amycolatopsis sp. TaxID=37632 RepID=UPI002B48BEA2|nr:hypothetical protein [Amycolatopsis sp.]HKS48269.1 hypothetical protein [Amycolatopsis sp.]